MSESLPLLTKYLNHPKTKSTDHVLDETTSKPACGSLQQRTIATEPHRDLTYYYSA